MINEFKQLSCVDCISGKNSACGGCNRYELITAIESLPLERERYYIDQIKEEVQYAKNNTLLP